MPSAHNYGFCFSDLFTKFSKSLTRICLIHTTSNFALLIFCCFSGDYLPLRPFKNQRHNMKRLTLFFNILRDVWQGRIGLSCLHWEGSKVDLMEFTYCLYRSGALKHDLGRDATLAETASLVYGMLGIQEPKNPSRIVDSLRQRKNPKSLSVAFKALCEMYPGVFSKK